MRRTKTFGWFVVGAGVLPLFMAGAADRAAGPPSTARTSGRAVSTAPAPDAAIDYRIRLRYGDFDPLLQTPAPVAALAADAGTTRVHIVQFHTEPLGVYREAVAALGGRIYKYLANQAYLVQMDGDARDAVAALPFVRWVGPYHPAYRLEPALYDALVGQGDALPPARYNILVFERGRWQQQRVADLIEGLGGEMHRLHEHGFRLEATLDGAQLREVVRTDEVWFVDRWTPRGYDMNLAREVSNINFVEFIGGFDGSGVRGEVMDGNVLETHLDVQSNPVLFHGPRGGSTVHGTPVTGIVFGDGAADPSGRGVLPAGQGIFADADLLTDRYAHTAELLSSPYFAVFQTNSWGGARTREYTTISAEFDDILFINDFLACQSQSNAGDQDSRPEAWAKNVVSVGGVNHYENLDSSDDCWCGGASVGPAADGRIKPDLVHFYDTVYTLSDNSDSSHADFCCTSAATPIVAGQFGLMFQMWHEGAFPGFGGGATVFDSRPHAATAKALLINTAYRYDFSGPGDDLTRVHQGWGMADIGALNARADRIFVVDESSTIGELETHTYALHVPALEPELRATLVYADPMGNVASSVDRINVLALRVRGPGGVLYWGNRGLDESNWSVLGGVPDFINTVQNVAVQDPPEGIWLVDVIAYNLAEDGHLETPEVDADYALVVSGTTGARAFTAVEVSGPAAPAGAGPFPP